MSCQCDVRMLEGSRFTVRFQAGYSLCHPILSKSGPLWPFMPPHIVGVGPNIWVQPTYCRKLVLLAVTECSP